jgi:type II secretory pathway pseudopilin PulG
MKRKWFTLLEILLSIWIFALLIWIILSTYSNIQKIKNDVENKQILVVYSNDLLQRINDEARDYIIESWTTNELHLCENSWLNCWNKAIRYRQSGTKIEVLKLKRDNWAREWDLTEWFTSINDRKPFKHADKWNNITVENLSFNTHDSWIVDIDITTSINSWNSFTLSTSVSFSKLKMTKKFKE